MYCAVDENNDYDGDELCNLSADDNIEPIDNADDVINELESLLEVGYNSFLAVFQHKPRKVKMWIKVLSSLSPSPSSHEVLPPLHAVKQPSL